MQEDRTWTLRDVIRNVATRWKEQYYVNGQWKWPDKAVISTYLDALNPDTASADDVTKVIGNRSWTNLKCDECKCNVTAIRECGDKPDYESATASLCIDCLETATSELRTTMADKRRMD